MLWQRSYPNEYQKLIARASAPEDPFSGPVGTPLEELTPADFGIVGWCRGIVPRVFDELGYSLRDTEGAMASWDSEGSLFLISHSPEAIKAFESRFPEIKKGEQAVSPKSDRADE